MAHVRQQIRDYVADLLVQFIYDRFGIVIRDRFNVGLEPRAGDGAGTLYKFRRYALDDDKLPALIVYTTTDISRLATIGRRTMSHSLELRVDIINKGASTSIFENIEQFAAEAYQHELNRQIAEQVSDTESVAQCEAALVTLETAITVHQTELDSLSE